MDLRMKLALKMQKNVPVQIFPKSFTLLTKMNTEENDNDRVSDQFDQLFNVRNCICVKF